jgi:hypothetical protein
MVAAIASVFALVFILAVIFAVAGAIADRISLPSIKSVRRYANRD